MRLTGQGTSGVGGTRTGIKRSLNHGETRCRIPRGRVLFQKSHGVRHREAVLTVRIRESAPVGTAEQPAKISGDLARVRVGWREQQHYHAQLGEDTPSSGEKQSTDAGGCRHDSLLGTEAPARRTEPYPKNPW
jgi:hypothetical protein